MASERGWVDSSGNAFVVVRFVNGEGVECLVDTGFNGDLVLPLMSAERFGLRFTGDVELVLAGGAMAHAFTSVAEIIWTEKARGRVSPQRRF